MEALGYITNFLDRYAVDKTDFGTTLHVVSHPATVDERLRALLRTAGVTSLMLAMSVNNTDAAKVFIAVGQLNDRTREGVTALILAAVFGCAEAVQLLLRKGADVNSKTDNGETALTLAGRRGRADIVCLLKEAGAREEKDSVSSRIPGRQPSYALNERGLSQPLHNDEREDNGKHQLSV
jgi:hypothetical protein